MAYRIRYQCFVDFVPPGVGLGVAFSPNAAGTAAGATGMTPAGNQQTIGFFNSSTNTLPPNSATFTSADITNLTNAMAADIAAQMTAQIGRIQNFANAGG